MAKKTELEQRARIFKPLTKKELRREKLLTDEDVREALRQGWRERKAAEDAIRPTSGTSSRRYW